MRTRNVRMVALGFTLLLAAAALGAAWLKSRGAASERVERAPSATIDAASLFEDHCARCHTMDDLSGLLELETQDQQTSEWLALLADHGDTTAAEDRALVEHLAQRAR